MQDEENGIAAYWVASDILERTNEGKLLSHEHLQMVNAAAKRCLPEKDEDAFRYLYRQVLEDQY